MLRKINSFVLRTGRVSQRQQHALDNDLIQYALPRLNEPWCLPTLFGNSADLVLEIGFGMGASLLTMAKARPDINFIGVEVHLAGIGSLVADLKEHDIQNVRIAPFDAVDVLANYVDDSVLSGVQIFFPDPWPKKRHHKRRLIQADFIELLRKKIKPNGFIHCATDWQDYAESMLSVLSSLPYLYNTNPNGGYCSRPNTRPLTKFEQRGQRLGHGVWDLIFQVK